MINADYCCDVRYEPLPFDDESIDIINCSHLIEHISSDCAIHLFGEAYRCLKRGGLIRISTPDLDEIIARYRNDDWLFFIKANGRNILNNMASGKLPADSILLPNLFVQWLASYSGRLDSAGGRLSAKNVSIWRLKLKLNTSLEIGVSHCSRKVGLMRISMFTTLRNCAVFFAKLALSL